MINALHYQESTWNEWQRASTTEQAWGGRQSYAGCGRDNHTTADYIVWNIRSWHICKAPSSINCHSPSYNNATKRETVNKWWMGNLSELWLYSLPRDFDEYLVMTEVGLEQPKLDDILTNKGSTHDTISLHSAQTEDLPTDDLSYLFNIVLL